MKLGRFGRATEALWLAAERPVRWAARRTLKRARLGSRSQNRCYPARMADPASKLEAKALKLPPEERARLAERLISSLDSEADADSEALWIQEAERRLEELKSGAVDAISAERVIEKARSSLR